MTGFQLNAEHRVLEWFLHSPDDFNSFFFCQNVRLGGGLTYLCKYEVGASLPRSAVVSMRRSEKINGYPASSRTQAHCSERRVRGS